MHWSAKPRYFRIHKSIKLQKNGKTISQIYLLNVQENLYSTTVRYRRERERGEWPNQRIVLYVCKFIFKV